MTTDTVCVACKMPNGVWLRREHPAEEWEPVMGGGSRKVIVYHEETGTRVFVAGNSFPHGASPAAEVIGGFAITKDVPRETWENWLKNHHDADMVKNRVIFAVPTMEDMRVEAVKNEVARSGLERIDPYNLPREFRASRNDMTGIEKATPGNR